jgi:citrate synthase
MMFALPAEEYQVDPVVADALDKLLILHADHEQNCSTSTVRIVGSSKASIYSSISAGINALWGPLHGGANQEVIVMLENIMKDGGDTEKWMNKAKDKNSGFRLMGFGHRVYKHGDSRVPTMKAALDTLVEHYSAEGESARDLAALYDTLESEFVSRKGIYPNLDYPSGPAYNLMGFDTLTFTPLFVAARVIGWTAHIMEQTASNALIRPLSAYNGPDERHIEGYVPDAAVDAATTLDRPAESTEG